METHVFKVSADGEFKAGGFNYDCKCVRKSSVKRYIDSGWSLTLDNPSDTDEKKSLIDEIKNLGGSASNRCSIETLKKRLSELKNE